MTTQDMKSAWRETATSLQTENDRLLTEFRNGNPLTSLERLRNRYRRFAILGFTMLPLSFVFMLKNIFPIEGGIWITLSFIVYFLTCGFMDTWLYRGLDTIDCLHMSVSEVIEKARYYRKKHLQFIVILIPMAIALLCGLAYFTGWEEHILLGMIVGGSIGFAIGLQQLFAFLRDYKNIA